MCISKFVKDRIVVFVFKFRKGEVVFIDIFIKIVYVIVVIFVNSYYCYVSFCFLLLLLFMGGRIIFILVVYRGVIVEVYFENVNVVSGVVLDSVVEGIGGRIVVDVDFVVRDVVVVEVVGVFGKVVVGGIGVEDVLYGLDLGFFDGGFFFGYVDVEVGGDEGGEGGEGDGVEGLEFYGEEMNCWDCRFREEVLVMMWWCFVVIESFCLMVKKKMVDGGMVYWFLYLINVVLSFFIDEEVKKF